MPADWRTGLAPLAPIRMTWAVAASRPAVDRPAPKRSAAGRSRPPARFLSLERASGPDFRPLDLDWVRGIRDRCTGLDVPLFFKQAGGLRPKAGGRLLDGRTWDELLVTAGAGAVDA